MSLESCIRKAGKAFSKEDAEAIKALRDDIYGAGDVSRDDANRLAVDEYIEILQEERQAIIANVEMSGGVIADRGLSASAFAQQVEDTLEEQSRVFPRKGVQRAKQQRIHRAIESLYPDFYQMPLERLKAIAAQYDPKAAAKVTNREQAAEVILDWVRENEQLPLRFSVDPVARSTVETNPDHPLSQMFKFGAVLNKAENDKPRSIKDIKQWAVDLKNMAPEIVLGGIPQTKLPDFIRYGMDSVREYTRTVKRMDAWMNSVMEEDHDLAKKWLAFNRKITKSAKILGEFMHASTLAGVDVPTFVMPSAAEMKKMNKKKREMWEQRAKNYQILKPFWDRLSSEKEGGDRVVYQRQVYDSSQGKIVSVGDPVEISEAQALYMEVRDRYANHRAMLMENLERRIMEAEADSKAKSALLAKLRKQFESGMINPYFPLSRFGKHQAVAYDPETGETVAYVKRERRAERNAWVEAMREQGFNVVKFEEMETDLATLNKIDPGFVANVTELIEDANTKDAIWQMYLRTLPELSARKSYIHRVGRLGFTHDALRAFSDHTFHSTHQMAKLRYGNELQEHLTNAGEEAEILLHRADLIKNMMQNSFRPPGFDDATEHDVLMNTSIGGPEYRRLYAKFKREAGATGPIHEPSYIKARDQILREAEQDGPWAVPLANELKRRHAYNMNPTSSPWSTKLTAFGFFWFLSTSPAAGVLNLTQTAVSAYPTLRARFAGTGAGMELLKASKDYAATGTIDRLMVRLQNDEGSEFGERAAIEEFNRIGIFSKTRTRELMGLAEAGNTYSARQEQILEYTGWIFHKTEEMNRVVTALAAYRLARKKLSSKSGMTEQDKHDAAVLEAEELVELSHYDYTNTNRPRLMQGDVGRVVFLFRNYSLNMMYRLMRDFRDGVWKNETIPKEQRKEARSRFLGIIGMTTIFAGVSGWPLMWAAESIANVVLGDDDDPFDAKTQARKLIYDATEKYIAEGWGEPVAEAVMKGPWSAFTNTDLSMRASLNNLWIREVPENVKSDPQGLMLHLAGEALGPIFGVGLNFAGGFSDIQSGHPDRAIEKFMPKFVGDTLKSLRYAQKGAQTYARDVILPPEAFSTYDLFVQAAGFMPTDLASRYEQNRAIKDMEQKLRNRRADIMNKLFTAWRIGDRAGAREAFQAITQWNKKNPRYPITAASIKQSATSRAQYDMRTVGGVAVDKRLQYLQNELRFTDWPRREQ